MRLHRFIREKCHGTIPEGYDVHHIDHDKNNNNIENLCLLSRSEHLRLHGKEMSETQKALYERILIEKAQPKARVWHGSEAGREWHRDHGRKVSQKLKAIKIKKACVFCEKEFEDNGFNKALFCSNNCKSAWRRKSGIDDIEKTCAFCGKTFTSNKYSKQQYCSKACSWQMRHKGSQSKECEVSY